MAFSAKIKGNHHLQGNVQVYNVRIPVLGNGSLDSFFWVEIKGIFFPLTPQKVINFLQGVVAAEPTKMSDKFRSRYFGPWGLPLVQ